MSVHVKSADQVKVEQAFEVWCALREAAATRPWLLQNAYYESFCQEAHDDLQVALARMSIEEWVE